MTKFRAFWPPLLGPFDCADSRMSCELSPPAKMRERVPGGQCFAERLRGKRLLLIVNTLKPHRLGRD